MYSIRPLCRALRCLTAVSSLLCGVLSLPALAQNTLRIAVWNVTNYSANSTARNPFFQTALYGTFEGRSLAPDILICQELTSATAVTNFRNMLNAAPGSPGDWAAAPWRTAANETVPDTNSAFFYRSSRVRFVQIVLVAQGGGAGNQPRNTYRYDVTLNGYPYSPRYLACYSIHWKAGSDSDDPTLRLVEARRIRANANAIAQANPSWHLVLAGDLNVRTSSEASYQEIVGTQANNAGRLFDPILTPGSWNNNFSYRFVHTQDPTGTVGGGMDDRFDQILLSNNLLTANGLGYAAVYPLRAFALRWDDPNHSYRVWGNDGMTYNSAIAVANNRMVGANIADALIRSVGSSDTGGHLPVFLDLRLPPVTVSISGSVTLAGIAAEALPQLLTFAFRPRESSEPGFTRTAMVGSDGFFQLTEVPAGNYDVAVQGSKWLRQVKTALVANGSISNLDFLLVPGDLNGDNAIDLFDLILFFEAYGSAPESPLWKEEADLNCDGARIDLFDLILFFDYYGASGDP
jgi:endonuclease/exonuclease/phosphatase family metal-dependent hydrolase